MAVYTKITKSEIEKYLENYSIGKLQNFTEIIEGIDNSNFILKTDCNKFILTIFESRINKNELDFFINLKKHLAENGVLCPKPIVDNKGAVIGKIKDKESTIVSFLNGANLKAQNDGYYNNITDKHCLELGKNLAKLHQAAQSFSMSRPNDLGISHWQNLCNKFFNQIDSYQKDLGAEITDNLNFLNKSWNHNLPACACHLDLFPDNVFFNEKNELSGVIDFYFAANDLMVYDFAIAVNAWCFDEKNHFQNSRFLALLNAYENVRKFSSEEKDFLKIALLGAAMRFLLTRLHDMFFTPKDALVKIKNPQEYLHKLRHFRKNL